jgi:hypothetical protein
MLVYFWTCAGCGSVIGEAQRVQYEPHFDPRGSQKYVTASR